MADTNINSLRLRFKDASDKDSDLSFRYAKTTATGAQVKALGEGIIANTQMYKKTYSSLVSAEFVITSTTPITIPT